MSENLKPDSGAPQKWEKNRSQDLPKDPLSGKSPDTSNGAQIEMPALAVHTTRAVTAIDAFTRALQPQPRTEEGSTSSQTLIPGDVSQRQTSTSSSKDEATEPILEDELTTGSPTKPTPDNDLTDSPSDLSSSDTSTSDDLSSDFSSSDLGSLEDYAAMISQSSKANTTAVTTCAAAQNRDENSPKPTQTEFNGDAGLSDDSANTTTEARVPDNVSSDSTENRLPKLITVQPAQRAFMTASSQDTASESSSDLSSDDLTSPDDSSLETRSTRTTQSQVNTSAGERIPTPLMTDVSPRQRCTASSSTPCTSDGGRNNEASSRHSRSKKVSPSRQELSSICPLRGTQSQPTHWANIGSADLRKTTDQTRDFQPVNPTQQYDEQRMAKIGETPSSPEPCLWEADRRDSIKRRGCLKSTTSERSARRGIRFAKYDRVRFYTTSIWLQVSNSYTGRSLVKMKERELTRVEQGQREDDIRSNLDMDWREPPGERSLLTHWSSEGGESYPMGQADWPRLSRPEDWKDIPYITDEDQRPPLMTNYNDLKTLTFGETVTVPGRCTESDPMTLSDSQSSDAMTTNTNRPSKVRRLLRAVGGRIRASWRAARQCLSCTRAVE